MNHTYNTIFDGKFASNLNTLSHASLLLLLAS